MFHETAHSVFVRERLLPGRVAVGSVGLYRVLTRITCIQPLTRSSLTFPASSFFSESRVIVFVCCSSFSFLSHHVFFLFYWPFHTRLVACLIRAALLPLSFCLPLFLSRCFVIGSSD